MSPVGTFETCRRTVTTSVYRGRAEIVVRGQTDAIDPERTLAQPTSTSACFRRSVHWFAVNIRHARMEAAGNRVSILVSCAALSRWYIREERAEGLSHRRVRDNRIAQACVRHARQHCGLNHRHDFTGLSADHRETENAVAVRLDQRLHEAARLRYRLRSQYSGAGQLGDANG